MVVLMMVADMLAACVVVVIEVVVWRCYQRAFRCLLSTGCSVTHVATLAKGRYCWVKRCG